MKKKRKEKKRKEKKRREKVLPRFELGPLVHRVKALPLYRLRGTYMPQYGIFIIKTFKPY